MRLVPTDVFLDSNHLYIPYRTRFLVDTTHHVGCLAGARLYSQYDRS
jgi:hypothetical protein